MEFHCVDDCSECCIKREYYPDTRFGKIGVLILPEEYDSIKKHASELGIDVRIIPRIGVSVRGNGSDSSHPTKILAYQMMGCDDNGDTCPFLDTTSSGAMSPHGGFPCRIYEKRPLACAAYPLVGVEPIMLDQKCKFCKEHCDIGGPDAEDDQTIVNSKSLSSETNALLQIKNSVQSSDPVIWRYATATGDKKDRKHFFKSGWYETSS